MSVDEKALREHLQTKYPKEDEACEWKEFKNLKHAINGKPGDDVTSYVSAIANMDGGQLVLGVEDGSLKIVGIREFAGFSVDNIRRRLAGNCAHLNSEKLRVEEFITSDTNKTVWVIHIPRHEPRLPIYAHGKPWQRLGDSLVPMRQERLEAICREPIEHVDWSAVVVEQASIADLDEDALSTAREKFKARNAKARWFLEIDAWDLTTFLDKARITTGGKLTRAAILLLGKPSAVHYLSPHPAQITWSLEAEERAYEHFSPPFILTTSEVLKRVRNVPQKLFPNNQLLAVEIQKYETRVILEALHNCIAHQDYDQNERIVVIEKSDRLIFENAGSFFEGYAEKYFTGGVRPRSYRNQWLANAMVEVSMIDTMGYGIFEMTRSQRGRYLPLPDYSRSTTTSVLLEVLGRPIDEKYSQLLLERRDLDIDTVILLDRVQKKLPITDEAIARLRREGLIEGRKPNFRVSASIAAATETEAAYTRSKGAGKPHLKQFVLNHLEQFESATREKFDALLMPMLPSGLTEKQKRDRVKNLLSEMRNKDKTITCEGRGPGAVWKLV